jgi:hypothetical protein
LHATVEESIDDAKSHEAAVGRDGDPDIDENAAAAAEKQESIEGAKVVVC